MKTMRIWLGCVLGIALSMCFGWANGFFFALLPIMVLMKADHWHYGMIRQLIVAIVCVTLEVNVITGLFQPYPIIMTLAVGILFLSKCTAMLKPKTYLFGFAGLLVGSIMLNFASYTGFDIEEFTFNLWLCAFMTAPITALAYWLFPEPPHADITVSPPITSDSVTIYRQAALGWSVSMLAFLLFQSADLRDSLSAQASIFIILAPMTLASALVIAKIRLRGTLMGCMAAMMIQLVCYTWLSNGVIFLLAYAIAAGFFCREIALGGIKSATGFSAISALTVPLTTAFVPEQNDAFFSILYRFSSIVIAVLITTWVIGLIHHWVIRVIKSPPHMA